MLPAADPSQRLSGLVEALDLALRLGVARGAVLLADAEVREQVLEAVAAADQARGVDRPVVGERGGRPAVRVAGRGEGGDHVVARDPPEHRAPEQVAGVVVEPADDLDAAPVREAPVGEVGLPDLVGRRGLEPDPGAPGPLVRLGDDETRGVEGPADGRGRRDRQGLAPEVPRDRDRPGVEPLARELRPEGNDPLAHLVGRPLGARVRPAGPRLDGLEPVLTVPAQEPVQVLAADPVLGRGGGDGRLRYDDLEDGHPVFRHGRDCRLCPDSPVAYQVSPMS